MLNFETIHKTTIKMNDATKVLKKFIVIISSKNRLKHLIKNTQLFVSSFTNKIDIFTFLMTKCIFEIENVNQLIQMLSNLAFAFRAQTDQFFASTISINYFRKAFNAIIYFNNIFFEQIEKNVQKNMMIVLFVECQIIEK